MTWSYDETLPTDKDVVRFLVGDIDTAAQLVQDEGIAWQLGVESNVHVAASRIASSIAAKFAREVDKSVDGDSISSSQRYKQFKELAEDLLEEAERSGGLNTAAPYVGGISKVDKRTNELDTDRIKTAVRIGVHDTRAPYGDLWTERQVDG